MALLIITIVVVAIVALLVWAVDLAPVGQPISNILKIAAILVGVLVIANQAGLF